MINDIDAPWEPLPDHFRKGVNLGYAYATEMYRWTIRPDALWPNTNTADPDDGWLTGAGHDTTNPNRVSQLFTDYDFGVFRQGMSGNPGFPNVKYFDHIVVNIDPRVFGADVNSAVVPATGGAVDGHSVSAIFQALADDINAARSKGLAVVLAMHAVSASPTQAQKVKAEQDGNVIPGPGQTSATRLYPGPYKVDLYTRGRVGNVKPLDQNHPLPKFWKTFLTRLNPLIDMNGELNKGFFAIRLGGESLSFRRTDFTPATGPGVPGELSLPAPDGFLRQQEFGWWQGHAMADYRELELVASREIWSLPFTNHVRILVSPGEPWTTEYERVYARPAVGGLPQKTSFTYRPYQMGDMWSAGFPFGQEEFFTKFIYVVHQYSPFHYTHPQAQAAFTRNQLKYQGRFDADLTGTGRSWFGPANPPPPPALNVPQNFPTAPPFQYHDFVLRNFDPLTPYPYERPFGRWHNSWQNPATMVTEFGVLERGHRDRIVPAPDLGLGESDPILPPGQLAEHDLMRARWHWDNRVWFENRNIGWSVWESFSGWNVFNGNLDFKDPNGNWIFNPSDRYQPLPAPRAQEPSYPQFFPAMRAALFGARP